MNLATFSGRSIFITGHTGFKGAWLCQILKQAGAVVTGYALTPETDGVFECVSGENGMTSVIGDVRNYTKLYETFERSKPEIVFHLAAQPLVLESYARPEYTFETNIMGTVNLLECVRQSDSVKSVVIITTDKVYRNNEQEQGYREFDVLGGRDPYSASKSCVELISEAYSSSFLFSKKIPLTTVRAGNVIGGGDISINRIIPDCVRAAVSGKPIIVRNQYSVRPYQHVLETLFAYLLIAKHQYDDYSVSGNYNIGPDKNDCVTTGELATMFCNCWGGGLSWENVPSPNPLKESGLLRLDCSKIQSVLGWHPMWDIKTAVEKTVEWEKARHSGEDLNAITDRQINAYLEDFSSDRN